MELYPYIHKSKGSVTVEYSKWYSNCVYVKCGKYKDMDPKTENMYQFTLGTKYGIDTDKSFRTPEAAFKYADKMILKTFKEVLKRIK